MKDVANYWIDNDLDGLECLTATYYSHRFAPHAHEEFVIGVIQSGAQRVRFRGGHEIMPENTTCVINPEELHTGHAATEAGWSYRVIYPSPAVLSEVAEQICGHSMDMPYFERVVYQDEFVTGLFLNLHEALNSKLATPLAKQSLLNNALAHFILRYGAKRPSLSRNKKNKSGISNAREYLDAYYSNPIKLDELADIACMSQFHFVRSFSTQTGIPPHVYQLCCRIKSAKKLLCSGMPLAEIAAETGFVDQSHLTNRFKAVVGVTPGMFRKLSKNLQYFPQY
ncbi:AraC family transcriptional regulator [Desulfovibrio gilichinskyi]|uniref:Transcriptional regulator, AraC family n=1 Tax=Desulfovibrio gilichinskyi TaxID=1519643 RepID=A0A1X7CYN2_9BACT|nr:AraC family transcriptional regulator [Desulfovibrio gilichinskyi]SMF05447.1 transcriptional regulator, AraC family [Desulfovibrio gilichinskyi]